MSNNNENNNTTGRQKLNKNVQEPQLERSNSLILGGILIAICSIVLLIFVLSDKVFHLS